MLADLSEALAGLWGGEGANAPVVKTRETEHSVLIIAMTGGPCTFSNIKWPSISQSVSGLSSFGGSLGVMARAQRRRQRK